MEEVDRENGDAEIFIVSNMIKSQKITYFFKITITQNEISIQISVFQFNRCKMLCLYVHILFELCVTFCFSLKRVYYYLLVLVSFTNINVV